MMGKSSDESGRQVQRFIRLTNLIPELLDLVDQKKISFNPAVELSYLTAAEQRDFLEAMQDTQNAPSLSQAQRIKKLSQEGKCSYDAIFDIMGEEKKGEMDRVTIKNDVLRKYFPRSYTPKQMQDTIIKLLEQWQKKRQRSSGRKSASAARNADLLARCRDRRTFNVRTEDGQHFFRRIGGNGGAGGLCVQTILLRRV